MKKKIKKRNFKKIAIVSGTIGVAALAPIYPVATISIMTVAAYAAPAIIMNGELAKFDYENKNQPVEKNVKKLTYKR